MPANETHSVNYELDLHDGYAVLRIHGSLDLLEGDVLREPLEKLAADRVPITVVDLSDVDFIGSTGLAALVYGHVKNRHHHGQMRLASPRKSVREVLDRTRLANLFNIYDSVEAASKKD